MPKKCYDLALKLPQLLALLLHRPHPCLNNKSMKNLSLIVFARNTLIASSSGSSPMSADSSSPCNIHKLRLETCDKSDEKRLVEDLPLAPLPSLSLVVELVLHIELIRLSHFSGNAKGKVQQSVTKVSGSRVLTRSNRVR